MKILVDADACPGVIRNILCSYSKRLEVEVIFVANHLVPIPKFHLIQMKQVSPGFDVADDQIIALADDQDLVITSDIDLAAKVLAKGCYALSSRGELFSSQTIRTKMMFRDIHQDLRDSGVHVVSLKSLSQKERRLFANHLDKIMQKHNLE